MSKPTTPLDSELAKIFGNNTRIFRAMRELFKQAGDLSPTAIEEALITGGNAGTAANQALGVIERLTQAVELLALMPRDIDNIKDDDLTPRQELITSDTLVDLSPISDPVGTDNSTDVTLVGSFDYLTISDQEITLNAIDLTIDVTDTLPLGNGGTGSTTLTAGEIVQIEKINSVTISNTQWGFVGKTVRTIFTATLTAGAGTITLNSTSDSLVSDRIGDRVHVSGLLLVSSVSAAPAPSGALRLAGLPIPAANLADNAGSSGFYVNVNNLTGSINVMQGRLQELSTTVLLTEFNGTTTVDDVANHIQAGTFLAFDFSYPA